MVLELRLSGCWKGSPSIKGCLKPLLADDLRSLITLMAKQLNEVSATCCSNALKCSPSV